MLDEEEKNAAMKRRIIWLLPYNLCMIWGTMKYCSNIKTISNKFWPSRRKATINNLVVVATAQALMFTSLYLAGTLAIIGVNPVTFVRE